MAFGVLVQLMMESKPRATVEEVLDFSTSVGLPITFADIGLVSPGDEVLKQIARRGTAKGETIHNEPFKVNCEVVVDALEAANDAGEDCSACTSPAPPRGFYGSRGVMSAPPRAHRTK